MNTTLHNGMILSTLSLRFLDFALALVSKSFDLRHESMDVKTNVTKWLKAFSLNDDGVDLKRYEFDKIFPTLKFDNNEDTIKTAIF